MTEPQTMNPQTVIPGTETPLPENLPLFVLPSILVLPRGRLPLNIFEPRYRAMVDDALGQGRMIGVVQQRTPQDEGSSPQLYQVGCAGKIMTFSETEKGNYLISLQGICRFAIAEELPMQRGYRRVRPDWSLYHDDLTETPHGVIERGRLFSSLRNYFKMHSIMANWDVIQDTADEQLLISLAMTCPFAPWEHQALLEARSLADRARLLLSLIEMAALDQGEQAHIRH
ncbi:MAG: LON peptidase substrate-binding domain-containing protein [Alphaproteobacteria bacterium]